MENNNVVVKKKPWLSVIIPAYNCSNTIVRLMDSLVNQNQPYDDIEIIICDDNSTDNFMDKVRPYSINLNIYYCKTKPREVHCPGNTRMDGWHKASGTWITFIDNDDMFEAGAFDFIKETIEKTKEKALIFTTFKDYLPETGQNMRIFDGMTWMHGKFYNRQWLIDNNIDFKENLCSHEDLYFNSRVFSLLAARHQEYTKVEDHFLYRWIYQRDSLSRKFADTQHSFIETFMKDYVVSVLEPWITTYRQYPEDKDLYCRQLCNTILYCYFYYQSFLYQMKEEDILPGTLDAIKYLVYRVMFEFNVNKGYIINFVYSIPEHYNHVKDETFVGNCEFVETKSFYDFIQAL